MDAERRYRLAYDRSQWIIQRRSGDDKWTGIWFIGDKKAYLTNGFRRHKIKLTPEAQIQLDALPVSYPWFRREVWQPAKGGYSHVGWKLSGVVEPVDGPLQRDPALEGMPPPQTATLVSESTGAATIIGVSL